MVSIHSIKTSNGDVKNTTIPKNYDLIVSDGKTIKQNQLLTSELNVGSFGQPETEIVLQNPFRIVGYLGIIFVILLCQVFLALKKKQFEKVQVAEISF
jgi:apocytochrome f|tara:strand:+ start:97 stop:390 length:294 start_codon:yes stop_codon:yes gene_type:complete